MVFEQAGQMKSEFFTLSGFPIFPSEVTDKINPDDFFAKQKGVPNTTWESGLVKQKESSIEGVNDPLQPLLPTCKRNKDNKLEIWVSQEQKYLTGGSSKNELPKSTREIGFEGQFR